MIPHINHLIVLAGAQAEKEATQSKAEREWERVRATGIGEIIGSATRDVAASSQPSLYDQLKKRDEESATEEESNSKNSGLPKMLDEDEARYFDEQKRREREETRKLDMQVDNFKRAAALASATAKAEMPVLPIIAKKPSPLTAKKLLPTAKFVPIKDSSDSATETTLKKRPSEPVEDQAPHSKMPKLEDNATPSNAHTTQTTPQASKPSLVKYTRRDDDE